MIVLIIANLAALFINSVIFFSLTQDYKKLYLLGFGLSLAIVIIFSIVKYGLGNLSLTDLSMILYRGGLILAFIGGALACFVATKLAKKA